MDPLAISVSFFRHSPPLPIPRSWALLDRSPADFFVRLAGPDNPLAVVVATLAGIPLYVNGAGVVPIAEALWAKGMSLGTVMAFTMSTIALSVPQAVMLRRVLKPPLLAIFFGTVAVGIMVIGFLFNLIG